MRGFRFQYIIHAYNTDIETHPKKHGAFNLAVTSAKVEADDVCKAAMDCKDIKKMHHSVNHFFVILNYWKKHF